MTTGLVGIALYETNLYKIWIVKQIVIIISSKAVNFMYCVLGVANYFELSAVQCIVIINQLQPKLLLPVYLLLCSVGHHPVT